MRHLIVIPARFASTRFPGKPLTPLTSRTGTTRPLIEWSWRAAVAASTADNVIVATDDPRICAVVEGFGGRAVMTDPALRNGTERCAAVLALQAEAPDVVVNFQGDNPLVPPEHVTALLAACADPQVAVATPVIACNPALAARVLAEHAAGRVGGTCAVGDDRRRALYFSKRPIPFGSDAATPLRFHVGLYIYRAEALRAYAGLVPAALELAEGLEQLRFLTAGIPVTLVDVPQPPQGIWEVNNPSDVEIVNALLPV